MENAGTKQSAQVTAARRRLLNVLTAGGAAALLPMQWTKPIVEGVLPPVHAQQTPGCGPTVEWSFSSDGSGRVEQAIFLGACTGSVTATANGIPATSASMIPFPSPGVCLIFANWGPGVGNWTGTSAVTVSVSVDGLTCTSTLVPPGAP